MGWSIGWDSRWKRDIGYGVPALCDHPGCDEEIDRGLAFVCGGEPYGGGTGCGLHFCASHLFLKQSLPGQHCELCVSEQGEVWFKPKPDLLEWCLWKLTDDSWHAWREEKGIYIR